MKTFLFGLLLSVTAFAANPVSKVPTAAFENVFNRVLGTAGYKYSLGTVLRQAHTTAFGVYDFSATGGAIGDQEVGITLPDNAIVRDVLFDVVTAPTSGGSATVAFKVQSAGDLKAATAIASWTGMLDGVPVGSAATAIKLTAERKVYATIATAALTAGKIKVFVDYSLSE